MQIIRLKTLVDRVAKSRSAIYDTLDPKSSRFDPTFPRPFKIGAGRAIGWLESEIDDWIAAQAKGARA